MSFAILILSILVQLCAAGMAFNLIRKTGRFRAWLLVAAALLFMAIRRTIPLVQTVSTHKAAIDPIAEGLGLLISLLMLAGVWMIGGVFDRLNRLRLDAEQEVEKRKQIEAELRASQKEADAATDRLRTLGSLIDSGSIVLFLWRIAPARWPVEVVSANVVDMLGYTADDFMTGRVSWPGITHPDDVPRLEQEVGRILAEGRDAWSQQYRLITKSGRTIWVEDQNRVIRDAGGTMTHIQAFAQDITGDHARRESLQESEIRLHFLSDNLPGGLVYQIDSGIDGRERRMTYISGGVEQLHEVPVSEALGDASWLYRQICEDDCPLVLEREAAAIACMGSFNVEARVILPSGKTRWRLFASAPRRLLNQHLIWDGIEIDITERKKAEEERQRTQKLESLGTVAGGIAHDFNNLLMGIFGNIELAKIELPPDHPAAASLQAALQVLETTRQLTTRLLTFAKGGTPVLETVDLRQRIRDIVQFNLTGSNVAAHYDMPDDLWPVKADKVQLAQVISNLTINAKEAMPSGGNLYIQAQNNRDILENTAPDLHGDYVKLTFRDEGIGIPKHLIEKIFDPYFTTKREGSGLGLAIAHGIVLKHKGHISVDSTPNGGTTFTIFLPVDTVERTQTMATQPQAPEPPARVPGHILLMDDEEAVRITTTRMLERLGYTVETSINGRDAIDKYTAAMKQGRPFDLAFMDLTIPGGMGGKTAIGELLVIDPAAKVIVFSGYSSDPVMADYSRYGFAGCLVKPFRLQELDEIVSRVLKTA